MEEKPTRRNGLMTALIIVAVVVMLFAGAQYSFKHDLLPARLIRSLLAGTPETAADTPVSEDKPASEKTPASEQKAVDEAILTEPVYDVTFDSYLVDTLLPEYGAIEESAVAEALQTGYAFGDGDKPAGAVGLCCAHMLDVDKDGEDEMIVLLIRQDGTRVPLEMRVYGMQNGTIAERKNAFAELTDLAGAAETRNDCIELVTKDGSYYLLYHKYVEIGTNFYDRYTAYELSGGKTAMVLDGAFSYYGKGALIICADVPPWIDAAAAADAPKATDAATGIKGTVLYADAIKDAAFGGGTVDCAEYQTLYTNSLEALDGMLGPLSNVDRIVLLDPLGMDWTDLAVRLSGEASGEDDADADVDGEWQETAGDYDDALGPEDTADLDDAPETDDDADADADADPETEIAQ